MTFRVPPGSAAWHHQTARAGFEVVFLRVARDAMYCEGCTTAVEEGEAWFVEYEIELDAKWRTRRAYVRGRSRSGAVRETRITTDGQGHWRVDGQPAPQVDGCFDIDLESSALTNAIPVHRLGLAVGASADAPAAYVRATTLEVERLDQRYTRVDDEDGERACFDYVAPSFNFACRLVYDEFGLVLEYPGIAVRVG
jgi:uncharacterized protein